MLPTDFGTEPTVDLAVIESLLGGLAVFPLPDRSRNLSLLLTVDAVLPLKYHEVQYRFTVRNKRI